MKNMFKVFGIAVLALTGCFMGGCDNGTTHTHDYSTDWSYNATQHWHECTAGDGAKADVADHDGTEPCSVCGYIAFLAFTGEQLYESTGDIVTGPMGDVAASLDIFRGGFGHYDDSAISDYFTGSAALTGGKITVNITPIVSALEDFNVRYDYTDDSKELCPGDVKGLMFGEFSDGEGIALNLAKITSGPTLGVIFVYVDRDTTFTGDTVYFDLNGIEAKKGWNYISADAGTRICEKITDLSGYRWTSW